MRACSVATAALLANPPPGLRSADLFTFTLRDGVTVYRWTSFDRDLIVNGDLFSSRKPWLKRSRWNVSNTMEVPTLEIQLLALDDGFAGGIDIKGQLTNGLFDGASATLDRIWFAAGTTEIVDIAGSGSTSYSTVTTVDLNGVTNAGPPSDYLTAGVTLTGFSPTDVIRVSEPSGGLYTAWNTYHGTTGHWRCEFTVVPDGDLSSYFTLFGNGGAVGYSTAAIAQSQFSPRTFSGASSYTFCISDQPVSDNTGGLSILVEKGAPTVTHPGIRLAGGNVANIDIIGNMATINVKGISYLLDQYAPRNVYQLGCLHAFCDAGCTLNRVAFTTVYTAGSSGISRTFIPWSGTAPANATNYRFGTVTFTSGDCAGQSRTVRSADSTGLTLIHPLIGTPAAGDAFTAFEGCDKAKASGSGQDCTARSNTQHWRAFPNIPPADSAF